MKISKIKDLVYLSLSDPNVLFRDKKYIFVISHMRSYTTLLGHILGSHEEINGYAEMHQSYAWWADLVNLNYKVYLANDNKLEGRYVLDKILHNYCRISDKILTRPDVRLIFMLRRPEPTIKSIIKIGNNVHWFKDPLKVTEYYQNRLSQLAEYGKKVGKKAIYFDAEKIISNTGEVLRFLTNRLDLSEELRPEYERFKHTGAPDFGDPTDTIKQGKIVASKNKHDDIIVPAGLLESAERSYTQCREILIGCCDSI